METRRLTIQDDTLRQQVLAEDELCNPGELIEIEDWDTSSTVIVRCEDVKEFARQQELSQWGGESPTAIPYLFRTTLPDGSAAVAQYAEHLSQYPLTGNLIPIAVVEKGISTIPIPDPQWHDPLTHWLHAGILRAFDYTGFSYDNSQNSAYSLPHVLLAYEAATAAAAGLELLELNDIAAWLTVSESQLGRCDDGTLDNLLQAQARNLDGNATNLSPLEEAAWRVSQSALKLDQATPLTPLPSRGFFFQEMGNDTNLAKESSLALLGIYQYLKHRPVQHQKVFLDLQAGAMELKRFIPVGQTMTDVAQSRAAQLLSETIFLGVLKTYHDFAGIELMLERPSQGTYTTLTLGVTLDQCIRFWQEQANFLKTPLGQAVCHWFYAGLIVFAKNAVLRDYLNQKFDPEVCKKDALSIMTHPLAVLASFDASAGRSISIDYGNRHSGDTALVYQLAKNIPQNVFLPSDFQDYCGQHVNRENPPDSILFPPFLHSEAFQLSGAEDYDRIKAIGAGLAETTAHELGHLLGLDHAPPYRRDSLGLSLMSGHERQLPTLTERPKEGRQFSPNDATILTLRYRDFSKER